MSRTRTKEVYFEELGYFCESQCEKIKTIMERQTYMNFNVSWSSFAGNCILICSTDYDASEKEIKNFFLSALIKKLLISKKEII